MESTVKLEAVLQIFCTIGVFIISYALGLINQSIRELSTRINNHLEDTARHCSPDKIHLHTCRKIA